MKYCLNRFARFGPICGLIFYIATLLCSVNAFASEPIPFEYKVEYCESTVQISEIKAAIDCKYNSEYFPTRSGIRESDRWIRVQVQSNPNTKSEQSVAIRVAPYLLKDIEFFQLTSQGWQSEKAGMRSQRDSSFGDIGGYLFITKPSPNHTDTYYLKIKASGLSYISISAYPWPNTNSSISGQLLALGAQVGILLAVLIFSLVSVGLNPSTLMTRFSISILNLLLSLLAGSGILVMYVFTINNPLNELFFSWFLCLRVGLWIWVSRAFLIPYKAPAWYAPSCWLVYGITGICMLLFALGNQNTPLQLMTTIAIAAPIAQIIAIRRTTDIPRPLRLALISGFAIIIALIFLSIISVLFPHENSSQAPLYIARVIDLVNPLVMLSIIVYQHKLVRNELISVKSSLAETKLRSEYEGKLLRDRGTLIDMLAHELKNPLTTISLAIDTLKKSIDPNKDSDQKRLKSIDQSIVNMDAIIEHCALMNSIDQKNLPQFNQKIGLKRFIEELTSANDSEARLKIEIDDSLTVRSDQYLLRIVINNLLSNGLKYSPPDSILSIAAKSLILDGIHKTQITISNEVEDQRKPDPKLIFQRFYRHPMAQNIRGSGLGLHICKELCAMLGGSIHYKYMNNRANFLIELPQ